MASLKKIKLHIEYLGKVKLSEIAPYKTISCIKDIAKELFKPINFEIKLIYNYKDISEFENNIIADYFKKITNYIFFIFTNILIIIKYFNF